MKGAVLFPHDFDRDRAFASGITLLVHIAVMSLLWAGLGARGGGRESAALGEGPTTTVDFVAISSPPRTMPSEATDQVKISPSNANMTVATAADTGLAELPPVADGDQPALANTDGRTAVPDQQRSANSAADPNSVAEASSSVTRSTGPQGAAGTTADDGLEAKYMAALREKIMTHWTAPKGRRAGETCTITVHQTPGGQVQRAISGSCTLDQESRRALEAAALMAQPLPYQGFEPVFREEIVLEIPAE